MNKKIIFSPKAPEPVGPYSQAILANDTLYISGQIGLNAETRELITENLAREVEQVMKNIGFILAEAGMSYENIIKSSIYITDLNTSLLVNDIYGSYFRENPPARELLEVSWLPKDANVKISCIAVK